MLKLDFWGAWLGLILLLTAVGGLAACQEELPVAEQVTILQPSATPFATPTLAPNVPTAVPSPTRDPDLSIGELLQQTEATAVPTVTPRPTNTPAPTPTATPLPAARLALAETALYQGDIDQVIRLLGETAVPDDQRTAAQILLGTAYLRDNQFAAAQELFNALIGELGVEAPPELHFWLGWCAAELGDWPAALAAYQTFHTLRPELGAYTQQRIADAYLAAGDGERALAALETALGAPAHRLTVIDIHQRLATAAVANGDFLTAVIQYDAIHALAVTSFTRGQMTYLAGNAALQGGDLPLAYARFQRGVRDYPTSYDSYLGLVELVNAEQPVDDFQRGLVNLNAGSYEPAIAAFERHLLTNPEDAEGYRLLAAAYADIGDTTAANAALDRYAAFAPAEAAVGRAALLARYGESTAALALYRETAVPENGAAGAEAAWAAAGLSEALEPVETAVEEYLRAAESFPQSEWAAEALFRAGWLAWTELGGVETAVNSWWTAVQRYPEQEAGMRAAVWLQRALEASAAEALAELPTVEIQAEVTEIVNGATGIDFFTLRARELAAGDAPFVGHHDFAPPNAGAQTLLQAEAEAWLRERLDLAAETEISALPPALAQDDGLLIGTELWELGLFAEAKRELEGVRAANRDDPLALYQLALYFRDLGLYRSSILAADRLVVLLGETVLSAPRFLGQLAYPVYYSELIIPLAEQYEYDPRLQFALVRQESLYESFATSSAVAQGLSQVIPDTGQYIANILAWPDYENADLYKPYVGLNFGAFYLQQQLGFFDGDVHAALAAYNAGPGNAAIWHETAGDDLDWYVETVNFPETELYIERIYSGFVIYDFLYAPTE